MNQRIYDLAGQAKFMAEEELNRKISYNAELKAFAEKFAELIVRECASIIESQDVDPAFQHRMAWAVKQRFGVE